MTTILFDSTKTRKPAARRFGIGVLAFVVMTTTVNADVTDEDRRQAAQMFDRPDSSWDAMAMDAARQDRLDRGHCL